jgi:adenylate cyclase
VDEASTATLARVAVGFADLAGFTKLGEAVAADELGELAERFAAMALEVAEAPVRLVKTIGDAAMLVSPATDPLLALVLDLVDAADAPESGLPAIHAGVARGPALARVGDYFGAAVNQASRVAHFARSGSVVVARSAREDAAAAYAWSFAGSRRLKGLADPVTLYRLRRAQRGEDSAEAG